MVGIFVFWEMEAAYLHGRRPQRGAHDHHEGEGGLQWAARSRCHGALAAPPGLAEARGRAPIGGVWGRPDHLDGACTVLHVPSLSRSMGVSHWGCGGLGEPLMFLASALVPIGLARSSRCTWEVMRWGGFLALVGFCPLV